MRTLSYLDNLVARNLPETAVIQPRPISLFEAWPGTAARANPFSIPATSEEETVVSPTSSQAQPLSHVSYSPETSVPPPAALPTTAPPAPAIAASPLPPAAPSTTVMRATQQPASPTPTPPTLPAALPSPLYHASTPRLTSSEPARLPRRQQPVDDNPAAKSALSRQPALSPAMSVNVIPASPYYQAEPQPAREIHTPTLIREHITLLQSVTKTPPQPTPTLVEIVREQPIQPLPQVTAASAITPEPASQPATAPAAIRPEQIKPFTPVHDRPAHHQTPVTPPPEPTPTVQITIGRIEVRATSPPAKAEQKQTQTPVLSLDDYLRQRNGGRP
jgi:hypothetical protein